MSVTCNPETIILYWSGELSEEQAPRVREHLRTCTGCRKLLADLEAVNKGVRDIAIEVPEISPPVHAGEKNISIIRWSLTAAAALLLIGLGVMITQPRRSITAPPMAADWPTHRDIRERLTGARVLINEMNRFEKPGTSRVVFNRRGNNPRIRNLRARAKKLRDELAG